jgi:amino acid transporter
MRNRFKRFLIGRPLKNEAIHGEKYTIPWGLPILASDAISSVAYAGQEMLVVMVPVIGALAYNQLTILSLAIIGLLGLLMLSYSQTIENYPNGGGAYVVAKENLGIFAGVTAGAALSVDYILTVAVSVSSGVEQLTSTFPHFLDYKVYIAVFIVIILMVGNLRGISESAKIFSVPTYAFIIGLVTMLIFGFVRYKTGAHIDEPYLPKALSENKMTFLALLILSLKAFSSGCTALTGVEAVSNAVPSFKQPSTKNAKTVLRLLSLIILVLFGGTSILARIYHIIPPLPDGVSIPGVASQDKAVLVGMAGQIFGNNTFMYFFIAISTFVILVLAANTAYSGFPLLVSVMAKEGYAPRQLSMRGDRLSYSNGIIALSCVAALLIVVFQASVTRLIGLYAIGVFISFTLSQSGMFMKWFRTRGEKWKHKAFINGLGAIVTTIVVVIIAFEKFNQGAWVVVFLIPTLMFLMLKVKKHYKSVSAQLRIPLEEIASINITRDIYRNRVIVPIESINKASVRALRYAKTISDNVIAFNVSIDEEDGQKVRERYNMLSTDIPLYIKYSPFRKVVDPLMKFIESAEYDYQRGDMITVILPQFSVRKWWNKYLHNQTRIYIERQLLKHKHIVVATMPLQLKDDDFVLKKKL